MPANRKSSNKTAHVLNVITAGRGVAEDVSAAPVSPPVAPSVPVVEVEHDAEELSDQIREALRQEVEREADNAFSVLQPEVIKTGNAAAPPSVPSAVAQTIPFAGERTSARPAPSPDSDPQVSSGAGNESEYVNVMQALVREKVPKYIKLLGVCPCSRCQADVEALALSHLEPKYIVLQKCQRFPLSVYENHYNAAVTSQIISACRVVMENPRH